MCITIDKNRKKSLVECSCIPDKNIFKINVRLSMSLELMHHNSTSRIGSTFEKGGFGWIWRGWFKAFNKQQKFSLAVINMMLSSCTLIMLAAKHKRMSFAGFYT